MVKVKKSRFWQSIYPDKEEYEEFNREKISTALVRAGARGPVVNEIAETIEAYEGISTDKLNKQVEEELEKKDPSTAYYWKTKRAYDRRRFEQG
jgi:hypothetical protein